MRFFGIVNINIYIYTWKTHNYKYYYTSDISIVITGQSVKQIKQSKAS